MIRNGKLLRCTLQVRKVYKSSPDKVQPYFRMRFSNSSCHSAGNWFNFNHKFLVFAKNSRLFGFEPLVSPLRRTKRAKKELLRALCSTQSQYCHKGKI